MSNFDKMMSQRYGITTQADNKELEFLEAQKKKRKERAKKRKEWEEYQKQNPEGTVVEPEDMG